MSQQSKMLALPSTSSGRDDDVLDALPYIDDVGYTEEHRAFALQLIEAECRTFARTKNYLKHMPEPDYDKFLTPRMLEEFQRMSDKKVRNLMHFPRVGFNESTAHQNSVVNL